MSKRGFTLVEVLIATGIAGFITFVGYFAISTTIAASNEGTARVRDTENARLFFTLLKREIATAFPGPGNMVLNHGSAAGNYNYNGNRSPLVLNDTSASPNNDIVQFYSRMDSPGLMQDEVLFSRYYVNRADGTLCRVAEPCVINATPPPDNIPPILNAPDSGSALFDGVRGLSITFQKWDPVNKRYLSEANSGTVPGSPNLNCDTLMVTLTFVDVNAQKNIIGGGTVASTTGPNPNNPQFDLHTSRTFSTLVSIPATFGP